MSLHLVQISENRPGARRSLVFDLSFIGAYPTGGEPLVPHRVGLSQVDKAEVSPHAGFWFTYDRLTARLHVYGVSAEALGVSGDVPVVFTEPGDPLGSPAKIEAGTAVFGGDAGVLQHDVAVFFTEPGDPVDAPAKVPAGTSLFAAQIPREVPAGSDLSILQHLQLTVEGF